MSSPVSYVPNFVSDPSYVFDTLRQELAWERRDGAPRSEYWTNTFDRPYTYGEGRGERTYEGKPSHPVIEEVRDLLVRSGYPLLEGCFLNYYDGKRDWLGWHADDDPGIDHTKPIAVITVGQGRNIQYREVLSPPSKTDKGVFGPTFTQMLEPGSLFLMLAGMQHTHVHKIPKADFEAKPRISLTFRGLKAAA